MACLAQPTRPGAGHGPWSPLTIMDLFNQGVGVEQELTTVRGLTERHWQEIRHHHNLLQRAIAWDGSQPVLLLERCWLRLGCIPLHGLASRLPPDSSHEAPELVRYRQLRARGVPGWQAEQLCWDDYGAAACREALQRYWQARERGNHGWTLERYLDLIREYRHRFASEQPRPLPLLVLARQQQRQAGEVHQLHWLCPGADGSGGSMRHTCP